MTKQLTKKEILVYADWHTLKKTELMGFLRVEQIRNKEIFSFEYSKEWLESAHSQFIDPDLQFYSGIQYLKDSKINFGLFLDSSPDRWGRVLMKRKESIEAKKEKRPIRTLNEIDYLLGVFDYSRMGALRFKDNINGKYLNYDNDFSIPPFAMLRDLEYASLKIESEDSEDRKDYSKWINLLIAPGSSLGGARPKANISDEYNSLWIAKFPSINDESDIGAWEAISNELAKKCGIHTSQFNAMKLTAKHHTFLSKRFDRTSINKRVHFASAMTLLGLRDGSDYTTGVSYLNIAEFIIRYGSDIEKNLEELWRRIVFNICISNTDDHLRNHGFLLSESGWELSPVYDINPNEKGTGLILNISENDNSLDLNLALEIIEHFRLNIKKGNRIIKQIKSEVSNWKEYAKKYHLPRYEMEIKEKAFNNYE
ncbi:MAG: HipA domain-containing protein [Ignavibacteriaceae bacterium]|jgi:serine/threonine-protein kinase HipA|nr:HipA domain-containing protein [Ignavibacteriaceae bacterium]